MSAIDHWDWLRYTFGIALIACNFGVWRGVALEESDDGWTKETGKRLLIRSLALEAFFAAMLFVVDTVGSIHQKSVIATLNAELAPRRLTDDQQAAIAKELQSLSSKRVTLFSYSLDVESAVLGFQIAEALKKAKFSTNTEGLMTIQGSGSIAFGVHVTGRDKPAVDALLKAFGKYLFVSPEEFTKGGFISFGAGPLLSQDESMVFVGVKPLAE